MQSLSGEIQLMLDDEWRRVCTWDNRHQNGRLINPEGAAGAGRQGQMLFTVIMVSHCSAKLKAHQQSTGQWELKQLVI